MKKSPDNAAAVAAFIATKIEIDRILARLTALSSDHVGREPDAVTWTTSGRWRATWKAFASDAAFHEGGHAV
jgi:hypothetical protein